MRLPSPPPPPPLRTTPFPYTTLFRSSVGHDNPRIYYNVASRTDDARIGQLFVLLDRYEPGKTPRLLDSLRAELAQDRKSTRLNSSHGYISYAVFCLKKKNINYTIDVV